MLLSEIKTIFHQELDTLYPEEEVDAFFYRMVEHYLNLERFVLVLQPQLILNKEEEQPLFEGLAQLKLERPLQYILGETQFMDVTVKVNEHVLIPRPETEELVQWVISEIGNGKWNIGKEKSTINNQQSEITILDIGTGSGCIAVALAKAFPEAKVCALDVSEKALEVARENAKKNHVEIEFVHANILDLNFEFKCQAERSRSLDIIVSNPPYVRESEEIEMHNNVKKYEPSAALFVPDENPLLFYTAIVDFARKHLKPEGKLYLEINQYLFSETKQLLVDNDFTEVELRKDIFGNFRMLKGVWTDTTDVSSNLSTTLKIN